MGSPSWFSRAPVAATAAVTATSRLPEAVDHGQCPAPPSLLSDSWEDLLCDLALHRGGGAARVRRIENTENWSVRPGRTANNSSRQPTLCVPSFPRTRSRQTMLERFQA